ncbi:MAG: polyketide cyclase [Acidimicrobiales bacterium]|nr:polyketide cyclase [Acidimicrobiales bacterium]
MMATMTPQEIAFADSAPVQAAGSAEMVARPDEVWAVLLDYPAWPAWFPTVKRCRATSEPPTGVGSTREVVLWGGSRFQERFIAWEDGRLWAFTATEMKPGGLRSLVERVTIEELEAGRCRVTYRMAFDPYPALKPLAPLLRVGISRVLTKAMCRLGDQVAERR